MEKNSTDKNSTDKKTSKVLAATETLEELMKLFEEADKNKDVYMREVLRWEILRCVKQKPLLIPSGQLDGLVVDPNRVF